MIKSIGMRNLHNANYNIGLQIVRKFSIDFALFNYISD